MCIVLYMKCIWHNGFAEIYAQFEGGKFGVVVFKAYVLNCGGIGVNLPWYMCIVLYIEICHEMCQVWCSGMQGIYAWLVGGHLLLVYVHCTTYLKLLWCNGFLDIYAWLEEGWWGQSVMKLIWCSGLLGRGSSASRSAKFGVVVFMASLLKWGPLPIAHRSMLYHYTP